jgi:hypothetical protein
MAKVLPGLIFLGLVVCFPSTLNGQSTREDTQSWNEVQISVPVTKNIDLLFIGGLRIGRDISFPVDERIAVGFAFKTKYLTVSPGVFHINSQPFTNVGGYENRLVLPITVRIPVGKMVVSDRNLFEHRLRHPGVEATRYRNRLQLDYPVRVGKTELTLFVSDEVFFDWSVDEWVRNRFAAGVSKAWTRQFTTEVYYLRQNDGRSRPGDLHVIGTAVRVRL